MFRVNHLIKYLQCQDGLSSGARSTRQVSSPSYDDHRQLPHFSLFRPESITDPPVKTVSETCAVCSSNQTGECDGSRNWQVFVCIQLYRYVSRLKWTMGDSRVV